CAPFYKACAAPPSTPSSAGIGATPLRSRPPLPRALKLAVRPSPFDPAGSLPRREATRAVASGLDGRELEHPAVSDRGLQVSRPQRSPDVVESLRIREREVRGPRVVGELQCDLHLSDVPTLM